MEKLIEVFSNSLKENLIRMTISNPRGSADADKIKIRPVLIKGTLYYQEEAFKSSQVFHKNLTNEQLLEKLSLYGTNYKQIEWRTNCTQFNCMISKKGRASIKSKRLSNQNENTTMNNFAHNRVKNYLLPENEAVDFLIELGIMTENGKVRSSKYDKFRQINRFLEFIDDIIEKLPFDREITILDFGCGKSYLTFAIYYYMHNVKKLDINIIGLDLKRDVIEKCNRLKDKLGYEKLNFINSDIADYNALNTVDMVVTLHACDTATDYALAKAVMWNAKVILSVPCCQHELNRTIKNNTLQPVLKYGLLKERMSALITDGMRAAMLEMKGYSVQILEFIDMEHTPKNILIRAIKNENNNNLDKTEEFIKCRDFLNADLTLEKLLFDK